MKKIVVCCLFFIILASTTHGLDIEFRDPAGDDDGPGLYTYPTDRVYKPGSFDLRSFSVKTQGNNYVFRITVNAKLENPWEMDSGFSIQMVEIYIDTDGQPGSGHEFALPGMNAAFQENAFWEKAVLISPQPASRVKTEIESKAPDIAEDVIVPIKIVPKGRTISAIVNKDALGIQLTEKTGFQVLLTSNEGFPDSHDILSRKVNEYEGQHRFGGGSDYDGDPHFMDILWPPAQGTPAEIDGQHNCLSHYASFPEPEKNVYVRLPMVRISHIKTMKSSSATDVFVGTNRADTRVIGFKPSVPEPRASIQKGEFGLNWSGKIYSSWLYGNDVSEHSVYLDPFGDGGHNGINSELELTVTARVSDYAEAGARIKNRFRRNYWATYWNNDDLDKAQYMKLRGVWVRFKLPDWISPYVETIHVGSSDLGMFSPWTVGRIRYIDRDNAMGTFLSGHIGNRFSYDFGRISLPEPWAGPGWTTRGKGYITADGFFTRDFAYALSLNFDITDRFRFRLIGDYTKDEEGDPEDVNPRNGINRIDRYENTVLSMELYAQPFEFMDISAVIAHADSNYAAKFDYIEKKKANPIPQKDVDDIAAKVLIELNDPFDIGLSIAMEYFNIGDDYITLMGARRETDVLLTEGFEADDAPGAFDWGGWWGTMGQVPSLNVDNYDTQFDETCYQTIVGWKGGTLVASYGFGTFDIAAEYTHIGYNTNMQGRDMGTYWDGGGFGAPGNAYNEYQDRDTDIAVLRGSLSFQALKPWDFSFRIKHIDDTDDKNLSIPDDDYENDKWVYDIGLGCRVFDELYIKGGFTLYDKDLSFGESVYDSKKKRLYLITRYNFGGIRFGYAIEKFTGEDWDGDWDSGSVIKYDDWNLVRSHAFLEVAF